MKKTSIAIKPPGVQSIVISKANIPEAEVIEKRIALACKTRDGLFHLVSPYPLVIRGPLPHQRVVKARKGLLRGTGIEIMFEEEE